MVRLTYRTAENRRRSVWAARLGTKGDRPKWLVLTDDGTPTREGADGADLREIIVGDEKDIVSEKPARLNLHYGAMELVT